MYISVASEGGVNHNVNYIGYAPHEEYGLKAVCT